MAFVGRLRRNRQRHQCGEGRDEVDARFERIGEQPTEPVIHQASAFSAITTIEAATDSQAERGAFRDHGSGRQRIGGRRQSFFSRVPAERLELPTNGLQNRCSTN